MRTIKIAALLLIVLSIMSGCQKDNTGVDPINSTTEIATQDENSGTAAKEIDPAQFVEGVTNSYFPLNPGDTFFYKLAGVEDGDSVFQDIYVTTTNDVKIISEVKCMVVHDVVMEDGIITEDTYDWYAQDKRGNVWYFGEDTKSLQEDGTWSTEGSFENGVDGAQAGVIMTGDPQSHIGKAYRQEFLIGQAQDMATVISTNETVTIGLGTFTNCVKTEETTVLDPGVIENKWYAPGVGQILSVITIGGDEYEELIDISQ